MKKCMVCGTESDLKEYSNVHIKTDGYYVPLKQGFVCKKCGFRIERSEVKNENLSKL